MANDYNVPPSRLSESTAKLREELVARNLYAPDTEYPLQNQSEVDKVVGTINTVIGAITPFKSYNLENTVYGRAITTQTPLTQIGLTMLGKQFALNSMSSIAQDNFPVIKPSNIFDGKDDTKLFTLRKNYKITTKSGSTNFQNFLNSAVYYYPARDYPFTKDPSNSDFIKNTGKGQLQIMYETINKNIYKQANNNTDSTFYDYADKVKVSIKPRSALLSQPNTVYFNFDNNKFYPYYPFKLDTKSVQAINLANQSMINSMNDEDRISSEYAPDKTFIKKNFGTAISDKVDKDASLLGNSDDASMNSWIDSNSEFKNEILTNKVVWGRDGTIPETDQQLSQLQGISDETVYANYQPQSLASSFNIRSGLLEYTRNLVNATEGRIGDITRKAFTKDGKIDGFNGSALWRAPSTALRAFRGRKGVRQHSALDQYDRFAKAIRFDGNNVYGGNADSVIYNSVLPRIHPTLNQEGKVDNKSLMLSIENLAVKVISKDGVGIIDDEYGSEIPVCEVGPFNGRIMWFPPFNMELQETASAKFEPTVMVGRNEPMYNYLNSERTATLNFTMLIDYPPQVNNYRNSKTPQKDLAEFFAFGGEPDKGDKAYIENLELKLTLLQIQINRIYDLGAYQEPIINPPDPFKLYFPNDVPKPNDNLETIVDDMYSKYTYEIMPDFISCDGGHYGFNQFVYFVSGLTSYNLSGKTYYRFASPPAYSQYTQIGTTDELGEVGLNKLLKDTFENPDNRKYYNIEILGSASLLYTEKNPNDTQAEKEYNEKLGMRRALAAKALIEKRLLKMFNANTLADLGINIITTTTKGSEGGSASGATSAGIPLQTTKEERSATIKVVRNQVQLDRKYATLTIEEQTIIDILIAEMEKIQTEIDNAKNLAAGCVMNERTTSDSAILHGFQSIVGNNYYPVFHSQTPEDFHKRLTFLQQCTRQGSAKRYNPEPDENGVLRARNSVFGRQPICILRVGDFFYTKVIIESVNVDYTETTWDMNPEGMGMQPMIAKITLNMKLIGGQSLKGPIDALQNAVSYNYYANSSFSKSGRYLLPAAMAEIQDSYKRGVTTDNNKIVQDFKQRNLDFLNKNKQ